MTVENLANIVMSELSYTNMWLVILAVVLFIAVGYLNYKIKKQSEVINDMARELRYIRRHLK